MNRAYEEITDWLAGGFSPADLIAYRPSEPVRERVADLIRRRKNEGISATEQDEPAHRLQLEYLLRLAKARHRLATVYCALLCLGALSCSTSHPSSSLQTAATTFGDNNVIAGSSQRSTSKGDGQDKLIIRGKNNLITYEITDSDIQSFNTKTVTIIEGSNNNITSKIRKCILFYKGRSDTIVFTGNNLKVDFNSTNIKQLITSVSIRNYKNKEIKQSVSANKPNDARYPGLISADTVDAHFDWGASEGITRLSGFETIWVAALDKDLPVVTAIAYYTKLAEKGNYDACYELGNLYEGNILDILQDLPRAIQFYELAARHNQAAAAYRLGRLYELGDFALATVAINKAKAKYYYHLAANNGNQEAIERLKD